MAESLGYAALFDELFVSCDIGSAKPNHEYFRHVVDVLGLSPDACLFVDDHEQNVASAREFGLRAEQFYLGEGLDAFIEILERHEISI
jgi:putative hydrolase of the HAD superfamily